MRIFTSGLIFCAVLCAGFISTARAADSKQKSPLEQALEKRQQDEAERQRLVNGLTQWQDRLRNKLAENERNLSKAQTLERQRFDNAGRYYDKKDYRQAKRYFKRALDISFYQWTLAENPSAKELEDKNFKPSTKKRKYYLATENTSAIYKQLMAVDERIFEEGLTSLRERADKTFAANNFSAADKQYDSVLRQARKMSENELAAKTITEVTARREWILDAVSKPLMLAETALEQKKLDQALDAVEEFETKYASFKNNKEVRKRYNKIAANPALRQEKRERAAGKLLDSGEAAFARGDYLVASRRFAAGVATYQDTVAGKTARQKLDAMMADEKIARTIKLQAAEYECKGLMARAEMLIKQGNSTEARAVYDEIIEKYPNTPWPVKAAEAKSKLEIGN